MRSKIRMAESSAIRFRSTPGRQLKPHKIPLGVTADGAVGGGGGGLHREAAVQTHPLCLHLGKEQLVLLHQVSEYV